MVWVKVKFPQTLFFDQEDERVYLKSSLLLYYSIHSTGEDKRSEEMEAVAGFGACNQDCFVYFLAN